MSENAVTTIVEKTHNARELSQGLSGSPVQRADETKTVFLTFAPGVKAEVVFTGQWSGRLIRSAFNAISKAYRRRRHIQMRPNALGETKNIRPELMVETTKPVVKPEGGIGDGN